MKVEEIETIDGQLLSVVVDAEGDFVAPVCHYLKWLWHVGRARNTIKAYAHDLRLYWEYLAEKGVDYKEPTQDNMAEFVFWLKNPYCSLTLIPRAPMDQARSNKTVNRALTAVVGLYDYLWGHDKIKGDINALIHVDKPRGRIPFKRFLHHLDQGQTFRSCLLRQPLAEDEPKTLTGDQMQKIIAAAGNPRDRLLIMLLYESALRIGEALALWLEDIDTTMCSITVRDRGQLVNHAEIKTPSSQRTVYVSRELINYIQDFVAVAHHEGVETNHLFIKLRGPNAGQPLSYPEVNDLFRRISKKTETHVTPHMFRHTCLSAWAAAGQPPERLKKLGGHRQVQSVYVYIHSGEDEMRAASESMQRLQRIERSGRADETPERADEEGNR